ncbi:MAG: TauD/TfdA family dioxygenase [Alphaproteobacteria bacterium]|jgi:alpha-ketoglutarate-dependent taurine dioxygenase|nr:TauD/TfdA family dioxygenase [Alphaproteobacteria bacterium]
MDFTPLHPSLGALVENVDCNDDMASQAGALKAALTRWQVLLFRDQKLADGGFVEFCRNFGALELLPEPEKRHPDYPEIFNLSNLKADGSLTHKDEPQAVFLRGTSRWHTDSSFREIPCLATVLYALTVPPEEGDTEFANMIAAHDSLSASERAELETLRAVHSYAYSRSTNPGKLEPIKAEELARVPDVTHPLIRVFPDGRRSIYLGTHASHIQGQPVEEGRARLRALEDKLTNVGNVYRHKWREGDLLIWDNRSTMHRLTGYQIEKYARVMRRCTVTGTEKVVPAKA